MSTDYATQLTEIYNKLIAIQGTLSKLALLSRVNSMQVDLQAQLNALTARMSTSEQAIASMTLTMSDILTEIKKL
jgi:hypothetical protein